MRGRPPLPTAVKEANGNPGKRALNHDEPKPAVALPEPPQVVKDTPVALAYWNEIGPKLAALRIITEIDGGAFTSLCLSYARAIRAETEALNAPLVFGTKQGGAVNNNLIGISHTAWKHFNRSAAEFGLTPSSRSRLVVKDSGDDEDDFARPE